MELHGALSYCLDQVSSEIFSPGSILSIYSLVTTFAVAVVALALRRKGKRGRANFSAIFRAIFKTRLANRPSFFADAKLVFLSIVVLPPFMISLALSSSTVAAMVSGALRHAFGSFAPVTGHDALLRAGSTLALFFAYEIGYFVDHYLKHRVAFLWAFHKVHHTADVLTPLTNYRNHPIDNLIFGYMLSIFIGTASGLLAWFVGRDTQIISVDGKNVIFIMFLWTIGHLQHSQFWIPFTGNLGRVLMSPAHHQIHHSDDPRHFNRNLGSVLAVWDWLFGTLEIPTEKNPRLAYGVKEVGVGAHSWWGMLMTPIMEAGSALAPRVASLRQASPRQARYRRPADAPLRAGPALADENRAQS